MSLPPIRNRFSQFVYYVLPLLLWMTMIFGVSTDVGSANNTRPIVQSILRRIIPRIDSYLSPELIDRIDWDIRKTAHCTEYGILTILAYRAIACGNPRFRSRNVLLPVMIAVLYAASDEYHQTFTATRQGCAQDVFYDSAGSFAGMILCLWQHCLRTIQHTIQQEKST